MDTIALSDETGQGTQLRRQQRGFRFWIRRALLGFVAALATLGALGAAYQAIATRIDRRNHTPPGQMVAVGAGILRTQLHIHCLGEGSPTVILEDGGGGFGGLDFALIQPGLFGKLAVASRTQAIARAHSLGLLAD